jgi:hypothetical protein
MASQTYSFSFNPDIPTDEVEDTLKLAIVAASAIHGESDVLVDAVHEFDAESRVCHIDGSTPAGRDLVRLFSGFLSREFGHGAFAVQRSPHPMRGERQPLGARA